MNKLNGQTILIGKEPGEGRLMIALSGTGKSAALGYASSVPGSVSRCKPAEGVAHAKISVDSNGEMVLTNMKPQNVTFVNGAEIATKHISESTTVELGKDRFRINLPLILDTALKLVGTQVDGPGGTAAKVNNPGAGGGTAGGAGIGAGKEKQTGKRFSIRPLQRVWEDYEARNEDIVRRQQEMNRKRMLPIMLGSLSTVASAIAGMFAVSALFITVPVAVAGFVLYFSSYKKKDTSYQERKEATDRFTDDYVCPNPDCGRFLGNMSYKLLKKQYGMHCPYCKCEYVE